MYIYCLALYSCFSFIFPSMQMKFPSDWCHLCLAH